jgi:hypothetical protein
VDFLSCSREFWSFSRNVWVSFGWGRVAYCSDGHLQTRLENISLIRTAKSRSSYLGRPSITPLRSKEQQGTYRQSPKLTLNWEASASINPVPVCQNRALPRSAAGIGSTPDRSGTLHESDAHLTHQLACPTLLPTLPHRLPCQPASRTTHSEATCRTGLSRGMPASSRCFENFMGASLSRCL